MWHFRSVVHIRALPWENTRASDRSHSGIKTGLGCSELSSYFQMYCMLKQYHLFLPSFYRAFLWHNTSSILDFMCARKLNKCLSNNLIRLLKDVLNNLVHSFFFSHFSTVYRVWDFSWEDSFCKSYNSHF